MKRVSYSIYVCMGALALCSLMPVKALADEAEYGKLQQRYVLHADGSQEMRVTEELSLYSHPVISANGETFIVYNPAWQTLTIHESYTKQADGTIIQTPDNAFVECLPRDAANAPAYNGLKEMVIVHTGLELGCTIYLDYTLTTRAGYLPALDVCATVEQASAVKDYLLSVTVPEGMPLHYALVNGDATPEVTVENGDKTVTWRLQDVPAMQNTREPNQALAGNVRVILANTYASIKESLGVLQAQFTAADDPEVTALSQKLLAGDAQDAAAVLKGYVAGLGNCRLSLQATGYRLRPASEVIRTAYGTEAEKLDLLAGLLKAAGLPAEVKAAYGVKADDADCLGLAAVTGLFLDSPEAAALGEYQPVRTLEGEAVTLEASRPVNITATMEVTEQTGTAPADGYRVLTLPQKGRTHLNVGYSGRTTNLLLPRKVDETLTCTVTLPAGTTLCTPQGTREKVNAVGAWRRSVSVQGDKVEVTVSLKLDKQLITPDDYADYRSLVGEWEDGNNATLLVKGN